MTAKKRPSLYLIVLAAVGAGIALGAFAPGIGIACKGFGDLFVRLVKLLVTPIVFATVTHAVAGSATQEKSAGKTFLRALLYFETLTTLALLIGLGVVHLAKPGAGIHASASSLDAGAIPLAEAHGPAKHGLEHLLALVPKTFLAPFIEGDLLQVLVLAGIVGVSIRALGGAKGGAGTEGRSLHASCIYFVDTVGKVAFAAVEKVMLLAPLGAFGAMAFTVGKYGLGSLTGMAKLMGAFYVTSALFVLLVLGGVCALIGVSLFGLLRYLREEIFLVLATSSSESALPRLMEKLEAAGVPSRVVRLVIPTGYSFNLDGTAIYLTMAAVFVAQALDIPLTLRDELLLLGLLLVTSKGAAAVTGGGFVTLAATLPATETIPVAGLALLLGVDRFMSEARAMVNLIGNAIAALVVARWEGELDRAKFEEALTKG